MGVKLGTEEVAAAAGMGQQVMNRHLRRQITIGIIRKKLYQWIRELELARLGQLQNRDGCKHLVHRADPEARMESIRNLLFAVGQTIGAAKHRPAVLRYQDGSRKTIRRSLLIQFRPQSRH